MNSVIDTIMTRRSCRAFQDKPIPRELLEEILQTAIYAPSGKGCQTWRFTVLTSHDSIQELAGVIGRILERAGYDMFRPAALVITTNRRDSEYSKEDNACALENIFLAAHSYGIGSVWINQLKDIGDEPQVRALLTQYGIPEDHLVYGMAALGYPASPLPKTVRKTGVIRFVD